MQNAYVPFRIGKLEILNFLFFITFENENIDLILWYGIVDLKIQL